MKHSSFYQRYLNRTTEIGDVGYNRITVTRVIRVTQSSHLKRRNITIYTENIAIDCRPLLQMAKCVIRQSFLKGCYVGHGWIFEEVGEIWSDVVSLIRICIIINRRDYQQRIYVYTNSSTQQCLHDLFKYVHGFSSLTDCTQQLQPQVIAIVIMMSDRS